MGNKSAEDLAVRKITFNPGHRKTFWHKNCVAIGLSAGFIEPLEATALVLIEISAKMIAQQFPANRTAMDTIAKRFNKALTHHWEQIIDFLKLHYVLTKRTDSAYWRDNCSANTIPDSLNELLELWKVQSPWLHDEILREEMFPSASYQYVYYGMKGTTNIAVSSGTRNRKNLYEKQWKKAETLFMENAQHIQQLKKILQPNRELIEKIKQHGMQTI